MPRVLQATPGGVPRSLLVWRTNKHEHSSFKARKARGTNKVSRRDLRFCERSLRFFATPEPLEALKIHIGQSESRK